MRSGFGAAAQRFVSRLPADLEAIASDVEGAVLALEEAVERRRAGQTFYAAPLVDDPRALVAQRLAGRWIQGLTAVDDRYKAFDALAAERLSEAGVEIDEADTTAFDGPARRVLRDFAIMGDALLVRSSRDAERISRILGRRRPFWIAAPGVDPDVPAVAATRRDAVVVWAPGLAADRLGVVAMALEYMHCEVIYVCGSGALASVRGTFVTRSEAPEALERAACIIDASIGDPASAIALARLNVPLVAATTAGASEFLDGVLEYDPWDWRSVFGAVSAALGAPPPLTRRDPMPLRHLEQTLARSAPPMTTRRPVVSVVVLTYNRRDLLPIALDSLAKQTYDAIDAIVINNGGENVSDIVARYPFARLIELEENILPNAAIALGLRAIQGEYFAILSDDDEYLPDHFARLVYALETGGGRIAFANTVTNYVTIENGERKTVAYRVRHDRPSDALQILVGSTMTIISMLFRRDVLTSIGEFAVELAPADLEYLVRAAQTYDFVQVDSVTCQWNYRFDGTSYTHRDNMVEGLRIIYERYPSRGSAIVERRREAELRRFDARDTGTVLWPPDLLLPKR